MASSDSPDTLVFKETQISSAITEDEVLQFFQKHGILYESDAEIGRLAATRGAEGLGSGHDIAKYKEVYMKNQRCRKLLQDFRPDYAFVIGADGYYYAATTSEEDAKGRITVFMLRPDTVFEFAMETHNVSFDSVPSPYRLRIIPYKQILGRFREIKVKFKDGGILVTHPRMAIRPVEGSGVVYAGQIPESQQS